MHNQLILHINLAGRTGVRLQFANKEFADEDNTEDSVAVSVDGGASWHQVVALTGTNSTSTYTARSYNLDPLGLTYSSDTLIRFQQYDNYPITTDGMAFDNIRVDAINTPPTNPAAVILAQINEDTVAASNSGTLVSAIVAASGSTDVDPNPLGIGVTAVDNSHGQWQYSTNGGAVWQSLSAVSTTAARLLDPANRVRFIPNADFNSEIGPSPTFSFKVWDETAGTVGGTGNTTTGTAFSSQVAPATQPITAINDAPVFMLPSNLVFRYENAGAVTVSGFATAIAPGPPTATDEAAQVVTFQVNVTGSSDALVFDVAPAIDPATGALTFTIATGTTGIATLEAILYDNGSGVLPNVNATAAQNFTIEIRPFPGDYNRDQTADAGDFILWRKTSGATVANYSGADGSGNGIVGPEDYDIWRANFGNSLPSDTGSGEELVQNQPQEKVTLNVADQVDNSETAASVDNGLLGPQLTANVQGRPGAENSLAIDSLFGAPSRPTFASNPITSRRLRGTDSSESNFVRAMAHRQDEALMAWLSRTSVGDVNDNNTADAKPDDKSDEINSQLQSIDRALVSLVDNSLARRGARLKALL